MATSPNLGTNSSSLPEDSSASALPRLTQIAKSEVIQKLAKAVGKANLFLVGGTVRDAFLGHTGYDLDLACSLPLENFDALLQKAGIRVVETGIKHGTITAVFPQNNCEITSFRNQEELSSPNLERDLVARDFTINAMAFSLDKLELIDPFQGQTDLKQHLLRSPGPADKCLQDDALRILRMIRFGSASGRQVSAELKEQAKLQAQRLAQVKVERIRSELEKILLSSHAADGFREMLALGLLPLTIPELLDGVGFEQNEFHIHDVFEHTLWVLERCRPDLTLRLVALFHDLGKPATLSVDDQGRRHFYKHEHLSAEICKRRMRELKFSNHAISSVSNLVELHMRPVDCGPAGVRRLLRDLGSDFDLWREFKRADAPPVMANNDIEERVQAFERMVQAEHERLAKSGGSGLAVNGDDLKELGIEPGRKMGKILKALEELIIETPELNLKEHLLEQAQKLRLTIV